jgi:hypothetical protein
MTRVLYRWRTQLTAIVNVTRNSRESSRLWTHTEPLLLSSGKGTCLWVSVIIHISSEFLLNTLSYLDPLGLNTLPIIFKWCYLTSFASGYPLNLSILVSGGKEIKRDSLSSGERKEKSPSLNPDNSVVWSCRVRVCCLGTSEEKLCAWNGTSPEGETGW